jgi:hypothetical protein
MKMEFEELQQIWNTQNSKPLYAIDEQALHNRILAKKSQAGHMADISELMLILVNMGAGIFVFGLNFFDKSGNTWMYIMAGWMLLTSLYSMVSRFRRITGDRRFDRSILGDLRHAISMAAYQVRLSQLMRWNIVPIGALVLLGLWEGGKPVWTTVLTMAFFVLAWFASGWEHRIYKSRKRELDVLQGKLVNDLQAAV